MPADRVVAAPLLRGQRLVGIPTNRSGFVPTDSFGRVEGLDDVFAVGDMTSFPIKHGGLATEQADRVAHVVAGSYGFTCKGLRASRVLRLRLLGADRPLFLRAELDQLGRVSNAALEHGDGAYATRSKVSGRYLVPYLVQLTSSRSAA
jgi:sulfide:quinone oxidoreductase